MFRLQAIGLCRGPGARAWKRGASAPRGRRCRIAALVLCGAIGVAEVRAEGGAPATPTVGPGDTQALRERIRGMREGLRDVPLPLIIEAIAERRVLPWQGEERERLTAVAAAVRAGINRAGVESRRVNEAGNLVEDHVLAALAAQGFVAGRPAGPSGRARVAGYPDLEARREGAEFYIEVKTYNSATEDSTQRTFYLSPSADFKVTRDAHHLLIAVELAPAGDGIYRAEAVRWLDLSRLRCDLKYEFNANNRDLYAPAAGLVILEDS